MELSDLGNKQLILLKEGHQAKIDDPENNGRTTAGGSMDLDYWMDTVEEIEAELQRRNKES
ncbi:hypothetical protein [Neptuniibacter sp. QD37_11]|uniref:hypothetical protein n=1 Tax=Neptuniibacter sp. QD37_11 TaxID=3398209 RepID=UPI0039F5950B